MVSLPGRVLNSGPVFDPLDNEQVAFGRTIIIDANAFAHDSGAGDITYSIEAFEGDLPTDDLDWDFHEDTGVLIWTPSDEEDGQVWKFVITATDGSERTDSKTFTVTVDEEESELLFGPGDPEVDLANSESWLLNAYFTNPAFSQSNCGCDDCPPDDMQDAVSYQNIGCLTDGLSLVHSNITNPHPIVTLDLTSVATYVGNSTIKAELKLVDANGEDLFGDTTYFSTAGVQGGDRLHIALQVADPDGTTLPTGHYEAVVTLTYGKAWNWVSLRPRSTSSTMRIAISAVAGRCWGSISSSLTLAKARAKTGFCSSLAPVPHLVEGRRRRRLFKPAGRRAQAACLR